MKDIFQKHPLPWLAIDVGDDKVDVVDANGKYVFEGNIDLPLGQWKQVVAAINGTSKINCTKENAGVA
jgi:hypothetical protein